MGKLTFAVADVRPLIAHAKTAPKHRQAFGAEEEVPGLFLVHDQGVYLMSSGLPRLLADGSIGEDDAEGSSLCAYAAGCDPRKDQDFWEEGRALVGGDDFAELLPLDMFKGLDECPGPTFSLIVNATSIRADIPLPKPALTRVDVVGKLEALYAQNMLLFLETPRGKRLLTVAPKEGATPAPLEARARALRTRYPKAVILNEMPIGEAVSLYVKIVGAKLID